MVDILDRSHPVFKKRRQPWVTQGKVNERLPDDSLIWRKYRHASDHFPLTATLSV